MHLTLDYAYVVRALNLPEEPSVCHFDLKADDPLVGNVIARSVVMSDAVLVWLCRKGGCVVMVDGISHTVEAGQLLVVFAEVPFRFQSLTPDFETSLFMAHVPPTVSYNSLDIAFPRIKTVPIITLTEQEYTTISTLFDYVRVSACKLHHSHRAELDVSIMSLFHDELADIFLSRNLEVKEFSEDERLVKSFEIMLATNGFEHRDVDYFAEQFNLPPKKFSQKVKRVTGHNPSEMISAAVIKNAKRLLSSTKLSTGEIAQKLHFATPSFFCRYFRRYTGLTPSEWRVENLQ